MRSRVISPRCPSNERLPLSRVRLVGHSLRDEPSACYTDLREPHLAVTSELDGLWRDLGLRLRDAASISTTPHHWPSSENQLPNHIRSNRNVTQPATMPIALKHKVLRAHCKLLDRAIAYQLQHTGQQRSSGKSGCRPVLSEGSGERKSRTRCINSNRGASTGNDVHSGRSLK